MLQYITHHSDRFTIPQQVAMVIEGGCRWVQLRMKDASDEEVESMARQLIPICTESGTILVIDDRVEVVMKTRVHGVHLGKNDMDPAAAREYLGPHAIIGCTANTAADILALAPLDIDYFGLGPLRHTETKRNLSPVIGLEGYRAIMAEARAAGAEQPVVAIGSVGPADIAPLLEAGVNGVAVSGAILSAPDPVAATRAIIALGQ
ncbi:MAG: thiamine phosphate synthase [Muribaculaceae bacterium]|nr:thiamine phosphate synthase [Muribaculaceae bacterium]MDE5912322.1 thiamine phosphate synthase [Muribaculaceae bacterium]MDE5972525.1 thiamine phosphate synthase [Muribaculaceae bacterium]